MKTNTVATIKFVGSAFLFIMTWFLIWLQMKDVFLSVMWSGFITCLLGCLIGYSIVAFQSVLHVEESAE